MENKIENLSPLINEEETNQPKTNQTIIIQKIKNINSNKNKLSNSINKKPLNIDINVEIDNVHLKNMKNTPKNNISYDSNTIFNYQKKDTYYTELQDKGANPHPKIIIQKIKNKFGKNKKTINLDKNNLTINTKREYNKRFNTAYNENNLTIRSSDSFLDISNKENVDDNTDILRNTQQNRNGIFEKKNNINENKNKNSKRIFNKGKNKSFSLTQNINKDEKENKENINDHNINKNNSSKSKFNNMRDELKIINNNKKDNNDIKIQKLNPNKIPKPQSRKMIERMLRLKDKKIEKSIDEGKTFIYDNKNLNSSNQNISFKMNKTEIINNIFANNQNQENINDDNNNNSNNKKYNNSNQLNNNILNNSNQNIILRGSYNGSTINNSIFPNQGVVSPRNFIANNINNINSNAEQMKIMLNKNNILPQNMNINQQIIQNQNFINIPNQNINQIQIQNQNIIQPNNNIIPQRIQNNNIIPQNNPNINPLNNIQIPPPTKNQNSIQRNNLFSPRRQIINLFPQNPKSLLQKDNIPQTNNIVLNQNNEINQQNINIIPKSNSNPNILNKKILYIQTNPNFLQQQNYDNPQKQNINMIPPKEPYINNQQNINNRPQPNLIINNPQNINLNPQQKIIIQKFPSSNSIRQNNNKITFQTNINTKSNNANKIPLSPSNNMNRLSQEHKNIPPIPQQHNANANLIKNQNIDFAPKQNNIIQFPPDMNSAKKQNINLTQNNQQNLQNMNIAQKLNFNIFQQPSNNVQPLQNNIQKAPINSIQKAGNIFQNNNNLFSPQNISRNPNLSKIQNKNNDIEQNSLNINKNININIIPPSSIAQVTKINIEQNDTQISQPKINNDIQNQNNIYKNEQQNKIIEEKINFQKIANNNVQNYQMNKFQNNQNEEAEKKLNENIQKLQFLMQLPNNTIIGNLLIKDGKVYYLNPTQEIKNNSNPKDSLPKIMHNLDNNQDNINPLDNNCAQQPQDKPIQQNQYSNYITNIQIISNNNTNNINNNNNPLENQSSFLEHLSNYKLYQQSNLSEKSPQTEQNINPTQLKNAKKINTKPKDSKINKILRLKEMNEHKPTKQYQIERKRPVYAVPPSKKRSVSQGKPFILIHKYYDENYILEDDEEEASKNEDISNRISKNISDDDEKN